jgi:hypothetical protein
MGLVKVKSLLEARSALRLSQPVSTMIVHPILEAMLRGQLCFSLRRCRTRRREAGREAARKTER